MTLGVQHSELAFVFQDVEVTVSLHRLGKKLMLTFRSTTLWLLYLGNILAGLWEVTRPRPPSQVLLKHYNLPSGRASRRKAQVLRKSASEKAPSHSGFRNCSLASQDGCLELDKSKLLLAELRWPGTTHPP